MLKVIKSCIRSRILHHQQHHHQHTNNTAVLDSWHFIGNSLGMSATLLLENGAPITSEWLAQKVLAACAAGCTIAPLPGGGVVSQLSVTGFKPVVGTEIRTGQSFSVGVDVVVVWSPTVVV